MTFEILLTLIIAAVPSVIAIIACITSTVKGIKQGKLNIQEVMNSFDETRKAVMDTKQYEDLKQELKLAHAQNRELKKKLNELLTKIDKVVRKEEEE